MKYDGLRSCPLHSQQRRLPWAACSQQRGLMAMIRCETGRLPMAWEPHFPVLSRKCFAAAVVTILIVANSDNFSASSSSLMAATLPVTPISTLDLQMQQAWLISAVRADWMSQFIELQTNRPSYCHEELSLPEPRGLCLISVVQKSSIPCPETLSSQTKDAESLPHFRWLGDPILHSTSLCWSLDRGVCTDFAARKGV